ncbi:MAG: hypothetical protein JOY61_13705 [Chloroflexi bacterium]|nr:hypothetical protein [Chloroflexota bacterium]
MSTIRRIYAYLLAFAGLGMLAVATVNLGQLVLELLLHAPSAATAQHVRETVSIDVAAMLVGLPVWLVHWRWTERWAQGDPLERASTLRRLYVYAVLAAAGWALAWSTHQVVYAAVSALRDPVLVHDALDQLPALAVAALLWIGHWRIASRDRDLVGEAGGSGTLRRWYLYAAAFLGFVGLLGSASGLLESLWRATTGSARQLEIAAPLAGVVVGVLVWLAHWAVLPGRIGEDARREDGQAVLRSVYLFLSLSVGVIGALFGLSQLLYYAVARLLGVPTPGGVGGDLLQAAAGPGSVAIVYSLAWAYHRRALRQQAAAFHEAPRQAGVRRLYTSIIGLIALAALAVGVAGLLWTAGDLVFNSAAANTGDRWRNNIALFSTLTAVGLPIWLLHWRAVPGSDADVRSLARRLYLYLALIAAMLSLVGSAALALYRVISLLLGESSTSAVLTDLIHALAVAIVAGLVAAYHWRILRADAQRSSAPAILQSEAPAETRVTLQIRAATPVALEQAIAALRSTGVEVSVLGFVDAARAAD